MGRVWLCASLGMIHELGGSLETMRFMTGACFVCGGQLVVCRCLEWYIYECVFHFLFDLVRCSDDMCRWMHASVCIKSAPLAIDCKPEVERNLTMVTAAENGDSGVTVGCTNRQHSRLKQTLLNGRAAACAGQGSPPRTLSRYTRFVVHSQDQIVRPGDGQDNQVLATDITSNQLQTTGGGQS